ncbi:hypothetical protein OE88DRAFT_25997 [Heliocybe sulcata]|uniref:Uncharacterized protein n=1 Tax=Heliocybe sulcata TaxID=5364 RepID=A0A5C3NJ47_9AGAM|nr:hypothetical protein OE88DRAFT_25997 [Heliocybe sulcata]
MSRPRTPPRVDLSALHRRRADTLAGSPRLVHPTTPDEERTRPSRVALPQLADPPFPLPSSTTRYTLHIVYCYRLLMTVSWSPLNELNAWLRSIAHVPSSPLPLPRTRCPAFDAHWVDVAPVAALMEAVLAEDGSAIHY